MVTLNADFPLRDQGVSNALGVDSLPRHRWYFVKEGFSPKLVERAIETEGVRPGEILLDPFSGGGTVALTGVLAGLHTRAFEVNPFLRFVSSTKLLKPSSDTFRRATASVLRALHHQTKSPLEGYSTFTAGNRWNRWLFPTEVLRSFESGGRANTDVDVSARSLVKLALIGAAMDCCNASRDGKCLRYQKDWTKNEATAAKLRGCFEARAEVIAKDLIDAPLSGSCAVVIEGDARKLVLEIKEKFRLCVTSPPYLNSFDYSDVYRPELFLGGFVKSTDALREVRLKTVRSHVQASWEHPKRDQFGALYKHSIAKIRERVGSLWDPRLPAMVQAYFEDMETVLRALRKTARKDASVWLVVSTSAYGGVEVPVDLILAEIGQQTGWYLREVGVLRHLRSSSQHVQHVEDEERKSVPLRESVVILDASPREARKSPSASCGRSDSSCAVKDSA
jgi:hypothetical protein